MKYLIAIIALAVIPTLSKAQNAIVGVWEINASKQLEFKADKTFVLTTNNEVKSGQFMTGKTKDGRKALILYIGDKKVSYLIKSMKFNKMLLYSPTKNKTMTITRLQEQVEIVPTKEKTYAIQGSEAQYRSPKKIFDQFETGRIIVNAQFGFVNYIDNIPGEELTSSPAVSLLYERSRGYRIGLGTKWSYKNWRTQSEGTTIKFDLLVVAPRMTYHPQLVNNLDIYGGFALPFSIGLIRAEDARSFKLNYGVSPVIGARYYPIKRLGISAEFAYDNTTNFNVGLALALN